ncbi:MAG: tRNA-2-methylthio-N(6)-dimethylallyladenosine synthase [Alphaproteobacteria bacterium MarineAlpha3_Bin5]|nr:MAG: tRNA-2-methylthio-N(6)-dimethylallyladenosine synthase [Alphaproteobacteria bacterium MarineAlpha3_Bin5]
MNVYDSNRMAALLKPLGYDEVKSPEAADMIILNTCHIREKAAEKIYSELGRLYKIKKSRYVAGERIQIAVVGCVAQAEGKEIFKRAPYVDFILGPQSYQRLPELVVRSTGRRGPAFDLRFSPETKFDQVTTRHYHSHFTAFLTIQEGCDKFCTFCVVPYTRGMEYSRPVEEILIEARHLVKHGVREITVLGQNVNAYNGKAESGSWDLAKLIRSLAEIDGLDRIRYTTSYPANMTKELIQAHSDVPALMPFIHLPVQSGSNKILTAMNRRHNSYDYYCLADSLRKARPDIGLSSDFIVGFPGESESDFKETINLVEEIGFAQAYSFKYSPRPGTPAASLPGQVSEKEKNERLKHLQDVLKIQQSKFNRDCVNKKISVLFDRPGKKRGQFLGRSPYMQAVHVFSERDIIGEIINVNIIKGYKNSLMGEIKSCDSLNSKPMRVQH